MSSEPRLSSKDLGNVIQLSNQCNYQRSGYTTESIAFAPAQRPAGTHLATNFMCRGALLDPTGVGRVRAQSPPCDKLWRRSRDGKSRKLDYAACKLKGSGEKSQGCWGQHPKKSLFTGRYRLRQADGTFIFSYNQRSQ